MMANLQAAISNRHDWIRIRERGRSGDRPVWLCRNCRLPVSGEDPDRPVGGCLAGIKIANQGRAVNQDYLEQEMRLRSAQEAGQ